jgi:hypothetical protein
VRISFRIISTNASAFLFYAPTLIFLPQSFLLGRSRGARRFALSGTNEGSPDQFRQPFSRFLAVSLTTSLGLRLENDDTVQCGAAPGQLQEALTHGLVEDPAVRRVEPKLDLRGDLVHVLASGSRTANESFFQLTSWDA